MHPEQHDRIRSIVAQFLPDYRNKKIRYRFFQDLKSELVSYRPTNSGSTSNQRENDLWKDIFKAILLATETEQQQVPKSTSGRSQSETTSRLSLCASTFRAAVQARLPKLQFKALRRAVEHILQTVSFGDETLPGTAKNDYSKSLRTLLEYQPHTEHLATDLWNKITLFCCEGISLLTERDEAQPEHSTGQSAASSRNGLEPLSSRPKELRGSFINRGPPDNDAKTLLEELLLCLQCLVLPSNAPILPTAEPILASVLSVLQSSDAGGPRGLLALAIFNAVFDFVSINSISLTKKTLRELLPALRKRWTNRSASHKEELIILLIQSLAYLEQMVSEEGDETVKNDVEGLVELMYADYSSRPDRDRLKMDEVCLLSPLMAPCPNAPLRVLTVQAGTGAMTTRSRVEVSGVELNWSYPRLLAILMSTLDATTSNGVDVDFSPSEGGAKKRRRVGTHLQNILRTLKVSERIARICALQVLFFMTAEQQLEEVGLKEVLDHLVPLVSEADGVLASWSMMCLAGCAHQRSAPALTMVADWVSIWHASSHCATVPASCRAACHLMDTILVCRLLAFNSIAESIDTIVSSTDLNGPSVLTDSTVSFWTSLWRIRNVEAPSASGLTSERILHWLFSKWAPAQINNRQYVAQTVVGSQPMLLLNLISVCTGRGLTGTSCPPLPCFGTIGQAWLKRLKNDKLLRFLLLLKENEPVDQPEASRREVDLDIDSQASAGCSHLEMQTLDYCAAEFERALENWTLQASELSNLINYDMVRTLTSLCMVGGTLSGQYATKAAHRAARLQKATEGLSVALASFITQSDREQDYVDVVLESVHPFLPTFGDTGSNDLESGMFPVLLHLAEAFKRRREKLQDLAGREGLDPHAMDIDFVSPTSRQADQMAESDFPRHDQALASNVWSLRCNVLARLHYLRSRARAQESEAVRPSGLLPIIEYTLSLSPVEFLACRPFVKDMACSGNVLGRADALALIRHIGEELLESYQYQETEVAVGMCLDTMTALAPYWSMDTSDELAGSSAEVYRWFIEVALEEPRTPSSVQIGLVNLLQQMLQVRPDYANRQSLPLMRASFLKVLERGDILVKYEITERISEVFGLFVVSEHQDMFNEVLQTLPREVDYEEGLAMRLLVFARLASSWYTVLRRSVYHIFETPGLAPETAAHASRCLGMVSKSLRLSNPRHLLKLFLPQIIYTWLETKLLSAMPFSIFGYLDLKGFLSDVRQEVVGQLVMRGNDEQLELLAETLELKADELILASFDRVAAYSIARDIALPPSSSPQQQSGGEARVRKLLGKEAFLGAINHHMAAILALFFLCLDDEDQIERSFARHPDFNYAARILNDIKMLGSSDSTLPPNRQPAFRAKYLVDEIQHLCRRTGHLVDQLWTPPLYMYVLRTLLDSIHPALGALHACSVLRRVRILLSLAGDVALRDYPLELLLHALMPFLLDQQCAADAVGLMRYLLKDGKIYLARVPSFVAGISLSILASLQVFFDTPQERTTQDGQLQLAKSKAQSFHDWFSTYLEYYSSPEISGASEIAFKKILRCACHIRAQGSAIRGTSESEMLEGLFEDERSGRRLLNRPTRSLALSLLCRNFQRPLSFREDIFGEDASAATYAVTVWRSCHRSDIGTEYLLWAGRLLGRTFAVSGCVPADVLRESALQDLKEIARGPSALVSGSKPALLRLLHDLLLSNDQHEVSLAERTLQLVVSRAVEPEELADCENILPASLLAALRWHDYDAPDVTLAAPARHHIRQTALTTATKSLRDWIGEYSLVLAYAAEDDPVVGSLLPILPRVPGFAESAFPFILHILLLQDHSSRRDVRSEVSNAFKKWLLTTEAFHLPNIKLILTSILYLRSQPFPGENVKADRERWLELDYLMVAQAAVRCDMFRSGLLWLEIYCSEAARTSRRSSAVKLAEPTDLLLEIFRNIDEPDSFYGVQQPASLFSIMNRLDYEKDGPKSLAFTGAHYDSQLRQTDAGGELSSAGVIRALNHLNLSGLTYSLLERERTGKSATENAETIFWSARRLGKWNLPAPTFHSSEEATAYRALQSLHRASDRLTITAKLDYEISRIMSQMVMESSSSLLLQQSWRTLAMLTEIDEIVASEDRAELLDVWKRLLSRNSWMHFGRYDDVSQVLSARESVFSAIARRTVLQDMFRSSARTSRALEVNAVLESSRMSRSHGALQSSLNAAMYLTELIGPCSRAGLDIEAISQLEAASVLWDQGEMMASIGMLKNIKGPLELPDITVRVGAAELLARRGHQVSEARLEKPDEILTRYLSQSIKELKGVVEGEEAGRVFHELASFCDRQLQDTHNLEDFQRVERLRQRKAAEVRDLEKMLSSSGSQQKSTLQAHRARAKQWLDLDDRDYQRLRRSREAFLKQSLENYLLSLKASDKFDKDSLRFCALWLEHSDSELANAAVSKHINTVPSRKFAALMNQLSSRLSDVDEPFQSLLYPLLLRICTDHPYHGMYQVFSISKSRGKDEMALSRHAAATRMAAELQTSAASRRWLAVYSTNVCYARLALEKLDDRYKPGSKMPLRKLPSGQRLEHDVPASKIPPPTMKVEVRADCDYNNVPVIVKYSSELTVAGGVSAPKIVTAISSNGLKYKQLVKGGNDDLRQDAIMEQVFDHVSELLQRQRSTRQRSLAIRTYKVLPLTTNAGIIEFVPNTIPLHDYLMPAHQKHFPKDWKPNACRQVIGEAQSKSAEVRLRTYRQATEHFHPVLRYFFMERYDDPDEWFAKRLAYCRSTAAISILGHVLGLGDRHGHNILLDEKTGEVVHIDLGVAFEQGRVLPVPEVVPFRLTRDIVDAMGITKTEGVFRRCCEFTLDALRKESYTIRTVLDVLRYDPLYSWTVSPLRIKKMQEQSNEAPQPSSGDMTAVASSKSKQSNEPNEADRALTVVAKKLSQTLSVTATVNELIQQATDERNLAVLYCGWAAYA